jgi:hypothetical protein
VLNSWLHEDYHTGKHFSPTYSEFVNMLAVDKHPLDITVQGESNAIFRCLNTLIVLNRMGGLGTEGES